MQESFREKFVKYGFFGTLLKPLIDRWPDALILKSRDGVKIEVPVEKLQKPDVQSALSRLLESCAPDAEKSS